MTAATGPGKIITFYSYKGGTGRSMALANVAWVLASNGRRVLAVDWDLEAPGLHRYFYPFLVDKELTSSDGVIDLMIDFENEAATPPKEGETPDPDWYKPHADILRYAASLDWDFPGDGTLDFIPAGRQGDNYSSRITSFNWQNFYDRLGGGVFLEAVKERMREEYDYILIDSRTGVSDASGICTVQMPDALAVCFTLNHQSIEGAAAVATSVYEQRRKADPAVQIFPIMMRVENGEKDKLETRREYAMKHFERFPTHIPNEKRADYWGEVEVIYIPYYAYEEILAPFGDRRGQTVSLLGAVERLTGYLTHGDPEGQVTRLQPPPEAERQRVLADYAREVFDPTSTGQFKTPDEELISTAEKVFASFTPKQQAIASRTFKRLVGVPPPGENWADTRLRVKRSDLGVDSEAIVDKLVYEQLVSLRQDEMTEEVTVELAHDALAKKWERMRDWLAEDRDFLLWRQRLQPAIAKWESTEHDEDELLHGKDLAKAKRYRATRTEDLNGDERTFIAKSLRFESSRKQVKRVKLAAWAVALLLVLTAAYQFYFYRERTLVFLGLAPNRYVGDWSDDFKITADRKPDSSLWDYPAGWTIGQGEGLPGQDGALLVQGSQMGVVNIKPPVLADFEAEIKVRIMQGTEAAWVFRAQPDKQRGYVFVLTRDLETRSIKLNGYVYYGNNRYEPLDEDQKDGHNVPFRDCCLLNDAFRIRAEVKGNEFKFWVKVENINVRFEKDGRIEVEKEDRSALGNTYSDTGIEFFIEPFKDNRSLFPYGNVGVIERGDNQMKVESIRISSPALK